jgi:hypothetical protein
VLRHPHQQGPPVPPPRARRPALAAALLRDHVEASKTKVRDITLHRLYTARGHRR